MSGIRRPPGPHNPLLFGQFAAFRRDPLQLLTSIEEKYGGLAYFKLGPQDVYLVSDPKLIEQILVLENPTFTKSPFLRKARTFLGEGLLTAEGQQHLRQRRLVQPAFHREQLMRYAADMVKIADKFRSRWQDGAEMDIDQEMMRLTLAIIGQTMFSADVEADAKEVGESMNTILGMFPTIILPFSEYLEKLPLPIITRYFKARETLDGIIYGIIEQRRAEKHDHADLLSMLIAARDHEGDGSGMSDKQVRDEAITLFLAGHETTANALTWSWYLLSQHPEVEERVHAEVEQVLAGRLPQFEDYPKLKFTESVMAEAMRLFPPVWTIGRQAKTSFELAGYTVPAKSVLLTSPYVVHRSKRYWPRAEQFDPDRWSIESHRMKFTYFPFGGGPRLCIGERFAWMEGVLLIAAIAQRWRLKLVPGHPVKPLPLITLRPRHGMKMILEARP